ncbi:pyruvate kinase [Clostridiales Family XIII bacterium BX16]|uniref:Pyruvate kinase n=1 Tax=Lentihominibacter faecis TaxID=2764712 RepID=A0A923NGI3_9FIRM|nr:pyruvate kinase [Lentihominibacter faecis]
MKKTKIVCTIGPASRDADTMREMLEAGMNVARLNFSHGTHEEHRKTIETFRRVRDEQDRPAAILLDTKGPEIRLGDFENGSEILEEGDEFTLTSEECPGTKERVSTTYKALPSQVSLGTSILIDDGRVRLRVAGTTEDEVRCIVVNSGKVSNRKGVNIPNQSLDLEYISEADRQDILFGIEMDVDYVAASFVRSGADVKVLRSLLNENGGDRIKIISKIENTEGIENFKEILALSDGIMIARGDMGVEVDFEKLPGIQKKFIKECCKAGKTVITATQMLESMTHSPAPTRAEITDVANAVFDGTSAVMLSGESAAGDYPVETVKAMAKIVSQAEEDAEEVNQYKFLEVETNDRDVSNAMGHAACTTAHDIKASAIVAITTSGYTAEMMAKYKPVEPIIAATPDSKTYHQQALTRGVYPVLTQRSSNWNDLMEKAIEGAERMKFVKKGDCIVLSAGMPLQVPGTTNLIRVKTIE